MLELRAGGILEPAVTRAVAVFQSTVSGLGERVQPVSRRVSIASQNAAFLVSALLTPAAVLAMVFGLWRLSSDLTWTANFPIANGLFSHWLVWIALAIGLRVTASLLDRPENEQ